MRKFRLERTSGCLSSNHLLKQGQPWGLSSCLTRSCELLRMETTQALLATVLMVKNIFLYIQTEPVFFQLTPVVSCPPAMHCYESFIYWYLFCRCSPGGRSPSLLPGFCWLTLISLPTRSPRAFSTALLSSSPSPACIIARALPSQVQEFGFVLVELHNAHVSPFHQLG